MVIDKVGYRLNVGIILANSDGRVFWGRRVGQDAWQFPQGGLQSNEEVLHAMYRELHEEVGLSVEDVIVLGSTKRWLKYKLPKQYLRHGTKPLVIGQKQKWFLLRINCSEQKLRLDLGDSPEFDSWRWVEFDYPTDQVIFFKQEIYAQVLKELKPLLTKKRMSFFKKFRNKKKKC